MPTDNWRVLVAEPEDFPLAALEALGQSADVDLGVAPSVPLTRYFDQYDAVLTRLAHRVERADAPPSVRCRVLGVPTTGLDHVDMAWCEAAGIKVVSLRGELEFLRTVRGTAEHTLALMLAVLRQLVPAQASVRNGNWRRDEFRGREIAGSTVGILGVGRIGTMVADIVAAMGATVIGFDTAAGGTHPSVTNMESLIDLCERSDILTIHVPFVRGQEPILGSPELRALKPGAVLINTSRGGVIDENALADAIVNTPLGGVGLDVLQGEPDITSNVLRELATQRDNIIITPHIGGNTVESRARAETFIVDRVLDTLKELGA